jgi:hypothetical protein
MAGALLIEDLMSDDFGSMLHRVRDLKSSPLDWIQSSGVTIQHAARQPWSDYSRSMCAWILARMSSKDGWPW